MERENRAAEKLTLPMLRGKRFLGMTYDVKPVEHPQVPWPELSGLKVPMLRGKRFLGMTYGIRSE